MLYRYSNHQRVEMKDDCPLRHTEVGYELTNIEVTNILTRN